MPSGIVDDRAHLARPVDRQHVQRRLVLLLAAARREREPAAVGRPRARLPSCGPAVIGAGSPSGPASHTRLDVVFSVRSIVATTKAMRCAVGRDGRCAGRGAAVEQPGGRRRCAGDAGETVDSGHRLRRYPVDRRVSSPEHACLQLAHAGQPAVGVVGLAPHVLVHLGVGQDQEALVGDRLGDDVGDLLGLEHDAGGAHHAARRRRGRRRPAACRC